MDKNSFILTVVSIYDCYYMVNAYLRHTWI